MSTKHKEWVIMVYLAADNNLGEEGVWTLTEISKVPLEKEKKVVVLFDSSGIGVDTQVFEFDFKEREHTSGSDSSSSTEPAPQQHSFVARQISQLPTSGLMGRGVAMRYGQIIETGKSFADWAGLKGKEAETENASSPDLLKTFIEKVAEKDPADHYALILSGHGSGAVGDFLKSGTDNLAGTDYQGMSIPTLGEALQRANVPIDILGMDSCLMSMAEVFFELPPIVKYLIGSEGFEPLTGWPYQQILNAINKAEEEKEKKGEILTLEEIALTIRDSYIEYYSEYYTVGTSVDMAVCDVSALKKGELRNSVQLLVERLIPAMEDDREVLDAVILAHWRAQSYKGEHYTDLWDFCHLLGESIAERTKLNEACRAVKKAIKDMAKSRYYGAAFQHSHGVSVYFPWKESAEILDYEQLQFAEDTDWGYFLKRYVDSTRRERRGEELYQEQGDRKKIHFISTSFSRNENGISTMHKNTPPYNKNTPPYNKNTPPYNKNTPPYNKNTPPYNKGELALSSSMKNPPNGFLIDEKTRKAIPIKPDGQE